MALALKSHRTRGHGRGDCCGRSLGDSCRFSAKALCVLIWASAALASLPKAIFSTTIEVMGEELCLVRFPGKLLGRDRQFRLGLHHVQKVLLGSVPPLGVNQPVLSAAGALHLRPPRGRDRSGSLSSRGRPGQSQRPETLQGHQISDHRGPILRPVLAASSGTRSEERRVGKECLRLCRSRWSPYH